MRFASRLLAIAAPLLLAACGAVQQDGAPAEGAGAESTRVTSTDEFQSRSGKPIDLDTHPGDELFMENCMTCHAGQVPKAPAQVWLEMMSPDMTLAAMNHGVMKEQAAHLTQLERRQIAEYLVRTKLDDYVPPAPPKTCSAQRSEFAGSPPAKVGWGHDNSRFVPAAIGGLSAGDLSNMKLKWSFAYPSSNRARSQPAIGWGAIFVGSQDGTVYAFDLDSGCARWTFRASAEVRTAIIADAGSKRLYFGDVLGRAYAIDAMTGKQVWRTKVDDHPQATLTGSPTLAGNRLFVPVSSLEVTSAADPEYECCTFRGSVVALNTATGKPVWRTYTVPEKPTEYGKTSAGTKVLGPSGAPVWGSPTYDAKRNRLYFGSGENYSSPADRNSDALFAVDAKSGKKIWQVQFTKNDAWNVGCMMGNDNCPEEEGPDLDLAASPLVVPLGGGKDIIVVGQKSGVTYGIDPENGAIVWSRRLGHGGTQGGVHFGMSRQGTTVYVPIVDMDDTYDGREYDASQSGAGIHAIDAATGKVLWRRKANDVCNDRQFCDPGVSAASTAIPGAVIAGHLDGRLRAYAAKTGKVLFDFDTARSFDTVGGTKASGGAMSGPGVAISDGYMAVNSGYGLYYHMPGNVLLVFEKR